MDSKEKSLWTWIDAEGYTFIPALFGTIVMVVGFLFMFVGSCIGNIAAAPAGAILLTAGLLIDGLVCVAYAVSRSRRRFRQQLLEDVRREIGRK